MKAFAVTRIFDSVPQFGHIICRNDGKYFYPVYDNDKVSGFEKISYDEIKDNICIVDFECDIEIGSERMYPFYCDNVAYIQKRQPMCETLKELIYSKKILAEDTLIDAFDLIGADSEFIEKAMKIIMPAAKSYYANEQQFNFFEHTLTEYLNIKKNKIGTTIFDRDSILYEETFNFLRNEVSFQSECKAEFTEYLQTM